MFEKIFCYFAEFCGVKIYKKYWPDGGSYWNSEHINPNKIDDLEDIIISSLNHFKIHLTGLLNESFVMIPSLTLIYFYGKDLFEFNVWKKTFNYTAIIYGFISLRHLYGLMVHRYNIIKAKNHLALLQKIKIESKSQNVINDNKSENQSEKKKYQYWKLYSMQIADNIFVYEVTNFNASLCFKFASKELAEKFYQKITTEDGEIIKKMVLDEEFKHFYLNNFQSSDHNDLKIDKNNIFN